MILGNLTNARKESTEQRQKLLTEISTKLPGKKEYHKKPSLNAKTPTMNKKKILVSFREKSNFKSSMQADNINTKINFV